MGIRPHCEQELNLQALCVSSPLWHAPIYEISNRNLLQIDLRISHNKLLCLALMYKNYKRPGKWCECGFEHAGTPPLCHEWLNKNTHLY